MLATFMNVGLILLGSFLGLLFRHRISARFSATITQGLALCSIFIGINSSIHTTDTMCMIVSMVLGIVVGEAIDIESHLDRLGDTMHQRFSREGENSRFAEGFITASLLYCVGSMAVVGALRAGIYGDYSILLSKGVLDGITSITFAAAMGIGVMFSAIPVFLYQGALTLIFASLGPVLQETAVTEMSAVGGAVIFAIGLNLLGACGKKIRVGNFLPAIFMPLL